MSGGYVVRRLLQVVPAVAAIILVTFVIVHAAPGDPVTTLGGEGGDEAYVADMRERYGLDRPLPEQLLVYAGNVFQGDLGRSVVRGQTVARLIGDRLPATLLLMATAMVLSTLGGVALGTLAANRPFGRFDLTVTTTSLVGYATPAFWLAHLGLLTLSFRLGLFPIQGMTDARTSPTGIAAVLDVAHHLALPAMVLAVSELALVTRLTRTSVLQEMGKDYVRTAAGFGSGRRRILARHALPNALLPVVTIIGTRFGTLVSGAVLVETVFAWPGLGQLLLSATRTRDYPLVLGLVLLVALSVVLANLVTDLAYARIDPRIRYD